MKKRIIPISLIVLCILSSCSQTPDNIQGNNHKTGSDNKYSYVSVKHILELVVLSKNCVYKKILALIVRGLIFCNCYYLSAIAACAAASLAIGTRNGEHET